LSNWKNNLESEKMKKAEESRVGFVLLFCFVGEISE
jgi:hypothetical protein